MRAVSLLFAIVVGCALLGLATPAHADDRKEQSHALWRLGVSQYDLGHFDQAIEHFEKAYEVFKNYNILYNLAQAHRQKGANKRALFYYRAYLRNKPEAANAEQIGELTSELEQLIKEQESARRRPPPGTTFPKSETARTQPPTKPLSPRAWHEDMLGWVASGVGIATLAVGAGFLVSAKGLRDDITTAPTDADRKRLRQDAGTRQTIGLSVALVGAAALTTGIILLIHNPAPTEPRLSVSFSENSTTIGLQGRF